MKRWLVAGLVRLYPSRWRAEYGEELAEVLMGRPLKPAGAFNVAASALWQQLRLQEPWVVVGAPLLLWIVINWITLLTQPIYIGRGGLPELGVAIFFGVGLWTAARHGYGGGRAAMKLAILIALPFLVLGILTLAQVVRVVDGPAGTLGFRLYGPANYESRPFQMFVESAILQIPVAGLIGWFGGLAGRAARAIR